MKKIRIISVVISALLILSACSKNIENTYGGEIETTSETTVITTEETVIGSRPSACEARRHTCRW